MRRSSVVLTGLVIVAACQAPPSSLEPAQKPIVAGAIDDGDPAIMELLAFKGNMGARCTATLITPRILIAAAHCLVETPGFERWVFAGNDDRMLKDTDLLPLKAAVSNPAYAGPRMGNDFSIIVLQTPLAVKPMRLNRAALEQAQGKNVRYVGYGIIIIGDPQSGGVKRQNTAPLASVSKLLLGVAPNAHGACNGDSGGPLLYDDGQGEAIAGIGSFVVNPACLRDSFYQRVDTQLAWIDEQIKKYDVDDGTGPDAGSALPDAGAADAKSAPPATPDAAEQKADAVTPPTESRPDARTRDASREPAEPDPGIPGDDTTTSGGSSGGCAYAGARGVHAGAAALLLALAMITRRRRR